MAGHESKDEASEYLLKEMPHSQTTSSSHPESQVLFSSDEALDMDDGDYPVSPNARSGHRRSGSWTEDLSPRARYNIRQLLSPGTSSTSTRRGHLSLPLRIISNRRCYIPTLLILALILPSLLAVYQAPPGSTLETHPWTVKFKETYGSTKESIWALGAGLLEGEEGKFGYQEGQEGGDMHPELGWSDEGDEKPEQGATDEGIDSGSSNPLDTEPSPDPVDEGWTNSTQAIAPPSHLIGSDLRLYTGVNHLLNWLPTNWPLEPGLDARKNTLEELEALKTCLEERNCEEGQKTVIVGGSFHFGNSQYGHVSGEDIWARSSVDAFKSLGHTILYGYEPLENLAFHRALGEFIPIVMMEASEIWECVYSGIPRAMSKPDIKHIDLWDVVEDEAELRRLSEYHGLGIEGDLDKVDEEGQKLKWGWKWSDNGETGVLSPGCVRRKGFEDGLPLWKLLAYHFWSSDDHALGSQWTMAPEDYASMGKGSNHYLGYSLEKYCRQHQYVKPDDRKDQAFVYGKEEWYFEEGHLSWYKSNHTFSDLRTTLGMEFVAAVGQANSALPDEGIRNMGKQSIEGFYQAIGESKVTIGIGNPFLSPTPYDSLCLGVPFINPINWYDSQNPTDHTKWQTQQDGLNDIGEPWVYHVKTGDLEGLEEAVKKARERSIEVFIPPRMTIAANLQRHKALVEADWETKAKEIMDEMRIKRVELNTVLL